MQAAAPAKMTPDTRPRGAAVTVFSHSPPSFPPRKAWSPKVTFHPLDIFLPRSKLRCIAASCARPSQPVRPDFFEDYFS
jgi:hypothetical protein